MCDVVESAKRIERSENGRRFIVANPRYRQINVVNVDGCLIESSDPSQRVDWLIDIPKNKKLVSGVASVKLIELKGSDVPKAFSQMAATLRHPKLASRRPLVDRCFIVSQQTPLFQSTVQNQVLLFLDEFDLTIDVVSEARIDAEVD